MIDNEEQVRCGLREVAELVRPESIRPLRIPPPRRRARTVRWLAPVAAAAAVAGLILGLTVAGQSATQPPTSRRAKPAMPRYAAMPKYYVTTNMSLRDHKRVLLAVVRSSVTGATIGSIALPQIGTSQLAGVFAIQPAASDRLFVIGAGDGLYALRLAADGHPDGLTRYPASVLGAINTISVDSALLSPDGSKIAVTLLASNCHGSISCTPHLTIGVLSLTTGSLIKWTDHGNAHGGATGLIGQLAWISEKELVVNAPRAGRWTYLALNVTGHGGSLLGYAKPITLAEPKAQPHWTMATVPTLMPTADAWAFGESTAKGGSQPIGARIVETSTRTGRLVHVAAVPGQSQCSPFAVAPDGFYFLVTCTAGSVTNGFGRVDGNRFTPLPPNGTSGASVIAAAW